MWRDDSENRRRCQEAQSDKPASGLDKVKEQSPCHLLLYVEAHAGLAPAHGVDVGGVTREFGQRNGIREFSRPAATETAGEVVRRL